MDCTECERLWQSYATATKRSIEVVAEVAKHLKLTGSRGDFRNTSIEVDAAWTAAREALYAHLASHTSAKKPGHRREGESA